MEEAQPSLRTMDGAETRALGTPRTSPRPEHSAPNAVTSSPAQGEEGWVEGGGGGGEGPGRGLGGGESLSSDCGGASDLQDPGSGEEGSEVEGSEGTEVSPVGSSSGGSGWGASFLNGHREEECKQEENNNSNSGGSSVRTSPVPASTTTTATTANTTTTKNNTTTTTNFTGQMSTTVFITVEWIACFFIYFNVFTPGGYGA